MANMTRDELIAAATELHDQEGCSCDRKYLMSCPNMANAILRSGSSANPDRACPHDDFAAEVEVNRLTSTEGGPVTAYSADVRVRCAQCGEPFRWIGVQAGLKPDRPMVSVDETELHAPMRPASADPDFGLGIPGFAITMKDS